MPRESDPDRPRARPGVRPCRVRHERNLAVANRTRVAKLDVASGSPAASAPVLKVALVAPSAKNDLAFTQSMVEAVQSLQTKYRP